MFLSPRRSLRNREGRVENGHVPGIESDLPPFLFNVHKTARLSTEEHLLSVFPRAIRLPVFHREWRVLEGDKIQPSQRPNLDLRFKRRPRGRGRLVLDDLFARHAVPIVEAITRMNVSRREDSSQFTLP